MKDTFLVLFFGICLICIVLSISTVLFGEGDMSFIEAYQSTVGGILNFFKPISNLFFGVIDVIQDFFAFIVDFDVTTLSSCGG